jgi:hypothetical protein
MYPVIWLAKMLLSHLLTDFILQPRKWITSRKKHHFLSGYLYLHGLITALVALILTGVQYWPVAIILFVSHIIIDGWKSYRKETSVYFLTDQCLHLSVIAGCWYFLFFKQEDLAASRILLNNNLNFWTVTTAFVFLSFPAGILIGQLTKKWRDQLPDSEGLANAGKWIGIIERIIILIFVLLNQYEAIGLLIAAKGIVRFNENNRPEIKTEYLLIGTLISIALAVITGIVVNSICL